MVSGYAERSASAYINNAELPFPFHSLPLDELDVVFFVVVKKRRGPVFHQNQNSKLGQDFLWEFHRGPVDESPESCGTTEL